MKIDVVMLAFNFNEELAQLTESAIHAVRQDKNMGNLVLVDNASEVRPGMLRELADVYVRNKTNLGYPAAVNQGMTLTRSEYVAIANNDIRVPDNWAEVAEKILTNPDVGSVHFRMIPYNQPFNPGDEVWITGKERWCHCSFFVIRREAFQVYDENYDKGGFDDYDHNHRMRKKGWKQAYTNRAEFQHMDSVTYRTMETPEARAKRDAKNREYYKYKFGKYPDEQFNEKFAEQMSEPYMPFP